jgi:hypothetical protein
MNEDIIKLRGKYEILKDELQDLGSQIATEAKVIKDWADSFVYCDRGACEEILLKTKDNYENSDIIMNRISRIKNYHAKATDIILQLREIRPFVKK